MKLTFESVEELRATAKTLFPGIDRKDVYTLDELRDVVARPINAIKSYRERTNADLKTSKQAIDRLRETMVSSVKDLRACADRMALRDSGAILP